MGYSSRYHVASLTAVFVALAIGILIGAALGSDVLEGTAKDLEKSLSEDLDQARAELADAEQELAAQQDLAQRLFPAVVGGRLQDRQVALIGLGDLDPALIDDVKEALGPSGATLAEVAAVRLPPETGAVVDALRGSGRRTVPRGEALAQAARRAGALLAGEGGGLDKVREALLTIYQGSPAGIDAVIVARSRPDDLSPREASDATTLEDGMLEGIAATGVPVAGVERSGDEPSSVAFFDARARATVDSIDLLSGQVALVLALAGAEGNFGVKDAADSLLPDLLVPERGGP